MQGEQETIIIHEVMSLWGIFDGAQNQNRKKKKIRKKDKEEIMR